VLLKGEQNESEDNFENVTWHII